jgi:hypothetical protein
MFQVMNYEELESYIQVNTLYQNRTCLSKSPVPARKTLVHFTCVTGIVMVYYEV